MNDILKIAAGVALGLFLFIFIWYGIWIIPAAIISERAYNATVNSDLIRQQSSSIEKQNVQIDTLRKANERQEVMIKKQLQ